MPQLRLNCDLGERGADHPDDLALLALVDDANIALGGHAGDAATAEALARLAEASGCRPVLHPGYPDPAGFGRRSRFCQGTVLWRSLDAQRAVLPAVDWVKFHGALYNDATGDATLATALIDWCRDAAVHGILLPPGSELERAARAAGMDCWREGFADRRYALAGGRLALAPRTLPDAVITDPAAAVAQVAEALRTGCLQVAGERLPLPCETWCVHSDSPQALATVQALRRWAATC